jgi:hypothetical protein
MGYSNDPNMVRVDFFKNNGNKWAYTEAIKWTGAWCGSTYYSQDKSKTPHGQEHALIHDAFKQSLKDHLVKEDGRVRFAGMQAICLEPYHEYSHPISIIVPEKF